MVDIEQLDTRTLLILFLILLFIVVFAPWLLVLLFIGLIIMLEWRRRRVEP